MHALAEFIALIYVPYFLQSPLAIAALRLDQDLYSDLESYLQCFPVYSLQHKFVDAAKERIMRHLWYVTEGLVVFALFDHHVADQETKVMAEMLLPINSQTSNI